MAAEDILTAVKKYLDEHDDIDWKSIGAAVKEGRQLRGVTQSYLVNRLGGDKGKTYRIEQGIDPIPLKQFVKIIEILSLPLSWFTGNQRTRDKYRKERALKIKLIRELIK